MFLDPASDLLDLVCSFGGLNMSKRYAMNRAKSEKLFSRTAGNNRVHPKNFLSQVQGPGPMRGGLRT